MAKIPAVKIEITRAEGPKNLLDKTKEFAGPNCWQDSYSWLRSQSKTFPKDGSYHKHDFKVVFADGEVYAGRLDCQNPENNDHPDLDVAKHLYDFLGVYAGLIRPNWMNNTQWKVFLKQNANTVSAYKEFMDKYDIPVS